MSLVTAGELALLRQRPHSTKLWLSIYKPSTVLSGRVNDASIAVGEREITYDNGAGASGDVESGMTMLVGTAAGKGDKGRIRVKSATATVITVAENSHIDWDDDDYLTVLAFYEIWPVFSRYTLDGTDVTWYKDYDVEYTNQNGAGLGTIIDMGCHYAGFTGSVYYSADGSVNVNGDAITYAWEFEGGSPASSNAEIPGNVAYSTPGHYVTKLTISSADATDVAYRHISIYDRPGVGPDVPILQWEMDTLGGSRDEGGYSVSVRIHEDVDDIVDGSLVVIFADDIYGSTVQSIGGNAAGRQSIVFVGYIRDGSVKYDYQKSNVEFEVVSPTEIMKAKEGTNLSVDSVITPTDWFEIQDLDIRKALYHYFRWQSTVMKCCDLVYNYTNYKFQYFDTDPSSIYDGINTFMKKSLVGRLSSDRQGRLYAEVDPAGINDAVSNVAEGIELTKQDWINEPEIEEIQTLPLSYLEMGGVAWSGAYTGTSDAYLCAAPGTTAAYMGSTEDHQGLILTSQTHLNTIAGDVFAWKNAQYPNSTFELSGNYRNFDIAPLERTLISLAADDTHRGIVWTSKSFILTDIEWAYDPEKQLLLPTAQFHEVTAGYPATTVIIPETPIENYPEPPPFQQPPFPIIPPIVPPGYIPPPVVPQPPPDDEIPTGSYMPTCMQDANAPANGPFDLQISNVTLNAGDEIFGNIQFWDTWIRTAAHVNQTTLSVNGCWEKSTDCGTTWEAATGSFLFAYAIGLSGEEVEEGAWLPFSGDQCAVHQAIFDSGEFATGYKLKLNSPTITDCVTVSGTSYFSYDLDYDTLTYTDDDGGIWHTKWTMIDWADISEIPTGSIPRALIWRSACGGDTTNFIFQWDTPVTSPYLWGSTNQLNHYGNLQCVPDLNIAEWRRQYICDYFAGGTRDYDGDFNEDGTQMRWNLYKYDPCAGCTWGRVWNVTVVFEGDPAPIYRVRITDTTLENVCFDL